MILNILRLRHKNAVYIYLSVRLWHFCFTSIRLAVKIEFSGIKHIEVL